MHNLRGIFLVVFSMATFAVEDALVKLLSQSLPISQVLITLGLGGMALFAGAVFAQQRGITSLAAPNMYSKSMLWRNICDTFAAVFFVTALALVPLSTMAAVFQATPLATTAGAAIFLGERVGWRRWMAVGFGFLGVLIIIRPGAEGFELAALLPLGAVIGIAARDLITRQLDPTISSNAVAFYGFVCFGVAGVILVPVNGVFSMPDQTQWLYLLGALIFGAAGYLAIILAMRIAETSILMPFRYLRLVFSLSLAMIIFSEQPDSWTYIGAAIVISGGIYTFVRERKHQS